MTKYEFLYGVLPWLISFGVIGVPAIVAAVWDHFFGKPDRSFGDSEGA